MSLEPISLMSMLQAAGAGVSAISTLKGMDDAGVAKGKQEEAARLGAANAKATAEAADQAYNKANPKGVQMNDMDAANKLYGSQGTSGTMLTGPGGVDQSTLTLGKKTLLGS